MSKTPEYSKMINLYIQNQGLQPYPVNFYPGVKESEINLVISQTLDNIRHHSKNQRLRTWSRSDGKEVAPKLYCRATSIMVSEVPLPQDSTFTSANFSPDHSQDMSTECVARTNNIKKAKDSAPTIIKKESCGPVAEKISRGARDGLVLKNASMPEFKARKNRPRSAAKSLIVTYKSPPPRPLGTRQGNEISLMHRSESLKKTIASQERNDTSITFNPLKNADQGNSAGLPNKNARKSSYHNKTLNEAQFGHETSELEESGNLKSRRPQLQVQTGPLKKIMEKY